MKQSFAKDSRFVLICTSGDRRTYLISPRSGDPDRAEPASAALAAQMSVGCWRPLAAAVARSCVSLVMLLALLAVSQRELTSITCTATFILHCQNYCVSRDKHTALHQAQHCQGARPGCPAMLTRLPARIASLARVPARCAVTGRAALSPCASCALRRAETWERPRITRR